MVRVRGGNFKKRALSLETGNFSFLSLNTTKKVKIISVVYNSTNNELVRTNTLVKGSIIQVDSNPFRESFQKIYKKKEGETNFSVKNNNSENFKKKNAQHNLASISNQLTSGKLLARICSRPGQIGRADGYILEGVELEFYMKKLQKKNR